MKKLILFFALAATPVEGADEAYVVNCGSRVEILISARNFPLGLPLSTKEVCDCVRRGWRGFECDMTSKNLILLKELDEKNNRIIEDILGSISTIK